jgi:hypothetical protein
MDCFIVGVAIYNDLWWDFGKLFPWFGRGILVYKTKIKDKIMLEQISFLLN